MRRRSVVPVLAVLSLASAASMMAGCAKSSTAAAGSTAPVSAPAGSSSPTADPCSPSQLQTLTAGTLTIATSKPAYPPYIIDDNPSSGKGYESAVAYAVAQHLGYAQSAVKWVTASFDEAIKPGTKNFDFDINQVSINADRQKVVDFSTPYLQASQGVVALKGSKAAAATTLADLKKLKFGVQVGTTSLSILEAVVAPTQQPQVFGSTVDPTVALKNHQIDALVADLPTSDYIANVELSNGLIVGQLPPQGTPENWGLVLAKNSPLTTCVSKAVSALSDAGTLTALQKQWLPFVSVKTFS
ncbi:MAG TPA: transporter substrate-binding domain-containing protein [Actinomycetes bacterium]